MLLSLFAFPPCFLRLAPRHLSSLCFKLPSSEELPVTTQSRAAPTSLVILDLNPSTVFTITRIPISVLPACSLVVVTLDSRSKLEAP